MPVLTFRRAPGSSRASIGGFDRTSQTFKALIYGAQDSIAMEDIFDSQYPGSEEQRLARKVARVVKLAREKRAADLLFGTANFNNDNSTNEFGSKFNAAGATPLEFLHTLKDTVFEAAHGINPDSLVLGRSLFRELARNAEVRGVISVGTPGFGVASGDRVLNDEVVIGVLRDVLGIPNIFVGQARQDTAVPGATSSESYIWTADSLFMGILKGSDAIVQKSGNVKGMPVAALNLSYNATWSPVNMTHSTRHGAMSTAKRSALSTRWTRLSVASLQIASKRWLVNVAHHLSFSLKLTLMRKRSQI